MITETGKPIIEDADSAVSWKAIFAGATGSAAVTMILVAFGIGVGFTVISPWSDQGISSTTFTVAAGVYLFCVAMLSSTIGGYLAGRLRSRWHSVNEHERYFRDSAHGFVVWALTTVVTAAFLGGATSHIISSIGSGVAPAATAAAGQSAPTDVYVDNLLRSSPTALRAATSPAQATQQATSPTAADQTPAPLQGGQVAPTANQNGNLAATRGELTRILVPSLRKGGSLSAADKTYVASIVSARTGMPQADAEQRVDQVITQAKQAADTARKSTALFALWLAASMLAGALSAALAAIEGGNLRNREWYLPEAERGRTRVVVSPAE